MSSNGAECGLHSAPLSMPRKGSPKRWEDKREEENGGKRRQRMGITLPRCRHREPLIIGGIKKFRRGSM